VNVRAHGHMSLSEHSGKWKVFGHPHLTHGCAACIQVPYELLEIDLRFGYKKLYRGAGKSLVRSGRKQATVTKL